jgi:hypothetical protein
MRAAICRFLVVLLVGLAGLSSRAQVYAVGFHRGPMTVYRVDEHYWIIGPRSKGYGLLQFQSRSSVDAPWIRQTEIYCAGAIAAVPLPAVAIIGIGVSAVSGLLLLGAKVSRKHRMRMDLH